MNGWPFDIRLLLSKSQNHFSTCRAPPLAKIFSPLSLPESKYRSLPKGSVHTPWPFFSLLSHQEKRYLNSAQWQALLSRIRLHADLLVENGPGSDLQGQQHLSIPLVFLLLSLRSPAIPSHQDYLSLDRWRYKNRLMKIEEKMKMSYLCQMYQC